MSGDPREEAKRLLDEAGSRVEDKEGGKEARSDVEELRMVLDAISGFLRDIGGPLKEMFNTLLEALDGARMGEDVASFYRKLRDSGMPEDMVAELTRRYFEARLEAANILGMLAKALRGEAQEEEEEEEGEEG